MVRRLILIVLFVLGGAPFAPSAAFAAEVAITIDDPEITDAPLYPPIVRNARILGALDKHKVKAALFVCGMRVDNPMGKRILEAWDDRGHLIANHTYSHLSLNDPKTALEVYEADFLRASPLLSSLKHFSKLFRFPFLKEGENAEKRDGMRKLLREKGYRNGAVTIDTSDWAIDARLVKRLREDKKADLSRYKIYYLDHVWKRAQFYDGLAKRVFGREIKHTLRIHHGVLSALFLGDLLAMFEGKGWRIITPTDAYLDPIFDRAPAVLPAGESLVWSAAKETGKYESELRYPGEDDSYERAAMDRFGL